MPYILKRPREGAPAVLPGEIAPHINGASQNDLKLIIYLYAKFPEFDKKELQKASQELGISEDDITSAVAFWRGAGVIEIVQEAEKKPQISTHQRTLYPAEQLAEAIDSVPNMKSLIEHCQKRFGKVFSPTQLSTLYSFYDELGFDADIIMLVAEHCCMIDRPSLGYMEKVLVTMRDNGITSYIDAEGFLASQLQKKTNEQKLRKLCGFESRALTPYENKLINTWFAEWNTDFALIEKAYEITVERIAKPSLKYMNGILSSWREKGITDPSQVEGEKDVLIEKSHDADEFFKAAAAKSLQDANI